MSEKINLVSFIREYTNNNFRRKNYEVEAIAVTDNVIELDGDNLFKIGDILEVSGSKYFNGIYPATGVDGASVTIATDESLAGHSFIVHQVKLPMEFDSHIQRIVNYQAKADDNSGIKSKSVSRVSVTYRDASEGATLNGIPEHFFGFLDPYIKYKA